MGCSSSQDSNRLALTANMGCSSSQDSNRPLAGSGTLLDKYQLGGTLGRGSFGIVYECWPHADSKRACAVKMVDMVHTPYESIAREAELLQKMDHAHITSCLHVFFEKCFVCIVMEKYGGGSLINSMREYWRSNGSIPLRTTSGIVAQIASPIDYLHQQWLVHRDVKGDNYLCQCPELVDPNLHIVLTDFGTVCKCEPGTRLNTACGTKLYWAPEFYYKDYAAKVDIWAIGVVLYGLITGRLPFHDENEVHNRTLKANSDTAPHCHNLLMGCLQRHEKLRIRSDQVVKHEFVQSPNTEPIAETTEAMSASISGETMDMNPEVGAGTCIVERTQELVERLQEVHEKVIMSRNSARGSGRSSTYSNSSLRGSILDMPYLRPRFTVKMQWDQGTAVFEWWDAQRVAVEPNLKHGSLPSGIVNNDDPTNLAEELGKMLTEYGVDITRFGHSGAKTMLDLASEVHSGASVMMLDAASHKKVVRVVDVVCLRIRSARGCNNYLVEVEEQGEKGCKKTALRLPERDKEPHENSKQTAEKILKESLATLGKFQVSFDWRAKETYEEEEESPSYPEVRTVYRKQIIEGFVVPLIPRSSARISDNRISLNSLSSPRTSISARISGSSQFSMLVGSWKTGPLDAEGEDSNHNKKVFRWMQELECIQKGIKLKAPEEGSALSTLVPAPIGMGKETLENKLKAHDINIVAGGQNQSKTLGDLAAELMRGESSLTADENGAPVRLVDVVALKIRRPDGRILVEVEHQHADGTKRILNRLPGSKRRADECQFHSAWRTLKRNIKMEEDHVVIKNLDVEIYEMDRKQSVAYPQLRSIYRKRIIPMQLKSTVHAMVINSGSQENLQDVAEDIPQFGPHVGNPVILGTEHMSVGKPRASEMSNFS